MRGNSDHAEVQSKNELEVSRASSGVPQQQEAGLIEKLNVLLSDDVSEGVNPTWLEDIFQEYRMRVPDGQGDTPDYSKIFLTLLDRALSLRDQREKVSQIDLFSKVYPHVGSTEVRDLDTIMPKLIINLVNTDKESKRSVLNALHVCIKHSTNRVEILRSLVKYGVELADTKTRTEVMVSLPVLITADVAKEDLFEIVLVLVRRLAQSSVKNEHNPPSLLCLERMKELLRDSFNGYIQRMPKQLQLEYRMAMESHKEHLPNSTPHSRSSDNERLSSQVLQNHSAVGEITNKNGYSGKESKPSEKSNLYYGIIPQDVMTDLVEENNYRTRGLAMENLATITRNLGEVSVILPYLDDLLSMIITYFDDPNFKIQMLSMEVAGDIVDKVNSRIKPHLRTVMDGVLRKFGDGKTVVKQAVNRIVLRLMQSVGPSRTLEYIYGLSSHRNSKVRQDTVDIIIIALLTFPSSEFDLSAISTAVAPLLLDNKRKIRHAVLECYSVLAQALGQGKLNPIVTAVDAVELRPGGDGVMDAVQSRLARRQLPKLKPDGLVEYSLTVAPGPAKGAPLPPDIDWILRATSGGNDGSAKYSTDGVSGKRYFSAGKRRLPWELPSEVDVEPRKAVGSAPLRPKPPENDDVRTTVISQDTWMVGEPDVHSASKTGESSYLGKHVLRNRVPGLLPEKPELNRSESQGSYFKLYKNKMKRLKQAGLQADQNMMAMSNQSPPAGYSLLYKKGTITERKSMNGDTEYFSKAGSQSLSPIRPLSQSPENVEDQRLSSSWSGSEALEQFSFTKEKPRRQLDLNPLQNDSPGVSPRASDSPVCVKPQLARSASKKRNQALSDKVKSERDDGRQQIQLQQQTNGSPSEPSYHQKAQSSPFDSKPRLVRTPSGKLSSGRWKSLERLTPIEKSQKSNGVDSSLLGGVDDTAEQQIAVMGKRSVSAVNVNESFQDRKDTFSGHQKNTFSTGKERRSPMKKPNSSVSVDSNNNLEKMAGMEGFTDTNIENFAVVQPPLRKSSSGLSKSALERAEKKRLEEKRKWEIEQQMKEERRVGNEEKRRQREREVEHRKQEVAKSLEEIKKLENLILAKQQEEGEKSKDAQQDKDITEKEGLQKDEEAKARKDEEHRQLREARLALEAEKKKLDLERKKDELRKLEKKVQDTKEVQNQEFQNEIRSGYPNVSSEARPSNEHTRHAGSLNSTDDPRLYSGRGQDFSVDTNKSPRSKKYETFDIDVSDMTGTGRSANEQSSGSNSANLKVRKANKNGAHGKPPVSNSPRARRKNTTSPINRAKAESGYGIGSAGTRSYVSNDLENEQQPTALSNPEHSFKEALRNLGANAEDWDLKCQGLHTVRCLAAHHPDVLLQQLHVVAIAVAAEVKNLRSQVTRTSLVCLSDMFLYLGRNMEPETEEMTRILLCKSSDTNVFIRQDTEKALNAMVQSVSPKHAIMALINGGASHKNKEVRKVCARLMSQVTEEIGFSRLLNGAKDITDRVIPTASQLALDGQQETRYYGRKMLYLMMEHPDFEKLLEKHVIPKNIRPVKDLVQTLRNKGLGDPPNAVSSAGVRKSIRQSDSAGSRKGSIPLERTGEFSQGSVRNGSGNVQAVRSSSHKVVRRRSRDESMQGTMLPSRPLDMDAFTKLTSSDWKERMEGIDTFYEIVEVNPDGVASSIVKVFDRYGPRLTDSNSKVLVYALQTLARVTPILRDGLIPVLTMVVQNLQGCIASKNELVYTSAANALDTLCEYVDCIALIQPLTNAIQFGNSRVKPEMTSRLAEIVPNIFSKKPHLIGKTILPMFWNLLNSSNAGSAGAGRNDLTTATTKLANQLYLCHGESLLDDAGSQGSRVKQRLVLFLNNDR